MSPTRLSRSKWAAVAICAIATLTFATAAFAQTETVLHNFGSSPDAASPNYGLVRDSSGNFYGVSQAGGAYGAGAIFELARSHAGVWSERVIHSFNSANNGPNAPSAGLLMDSAGNLYGIAQLGGARRDGAVFELARQASGGWSEKTLYSFGTSTTDGAAPAGTLIMDASGNLYGTTGSGGTDNRGTVFELSPSSSGWKEKIIHLFNGYPHDGKAPGGALTFDSAGNLYGTAGLGGLYQKGIVYELSPASGGTWNEKVLHNFPSNNEDGGEPSSGVILDSAGNLYGTAPFGGPNLFGIVFELTPSTGGSWTETILHSFSNNATDPGMPAAGVIFDNAGDLYGTANSGGPNGYGAVYKLTPGGDGSWTETIVWSFDDTDGDLPQSPLFMDASGNFYGETTNGGGIGYGTVYEIIP